MRKLTGLALAAVMVVGATGQAAATGGTGYTRAELQRDLDAIHEQGVIGVQARAVTGDGREWTVTSGTGDVVGDRPVPPNGHYRIASNTKTFVAAVVLQLVAEGRLSLEDTVERHLPGLIRGNGNDGRLITVRQLLQHTSGLYDYHRDLPVDAKGWQERRFDHYDPEQLVAMAVSHPPSFAPGTGWSYSNTGYVVAGLIIKRVTGNTWAHEVQRRIIKPLRLSNTSIPGDDPRVPSPHARAYQQWELGGPLTDTTEFNASSSDAAGQIISTPGDLSRFFLALLSGKVLRPAQLAEMRRIVPADGGLSLGYGLGLYQNRLSCGGFYWDHGGNTTGVISRGGVSQDGKRGIALVYTGAHGDSREDIAGLQAASEKIVDRFFCGD